MLRSVGTKAFPLAGIFVSVALHQKIKPPYEITMIFLPTSQRWREMRKSAFTLRGHNQQREGNLARAKRPFQRASSP